MKERLINIFVYSDGTHVHSIGWRVYEKAGTYEEMTAFLRYRVQYDHRIASRKDLKEPMLWRDFEVMNRQNPIAGGLVEASIVREKDIYLVTHIVNGEMRVDGTVDSEGKGAIPDYLQVYLTDAGFDFPRLIYDDFFEATHLLWNNQKYVSCLKLVFSAIDTLGFVEYGTDDGNCFTKWLDEYCDLGLVGVTSAELWELRNSLIHMTNLDSWKVRSGKTHRLLPRFTHPKQDLEPFFDGIKVLHASRFVTVALPQGIKKWLQSYNRDRGKFVEFVERYDTVVSEARLRKIYT